MLSEDTVRGLERVYPNGQKITDPLSLNLYTYSFNNPIMYSDPTENFPILIVTILGGAVIGAVVGFTVNLAVQTTTKGWDNVNWSEVWINTGAGAVTGALAGTGWPLIAVASLDGVVGIGSYYGTQKVNNQKTTPGGYIISAATGFASGLIGGNSKPLLKELNEIQDAFNWASFTRSLNGQQYNANEFFNVSANSLKSSAFLTGIGNGITYGVPAIVNDKDKIMELQKLLGLKQTGIFDEQTSNNLIQLQIATQMAMNPKLTANDFLPNGWLKPLPPGR